MHIMIDIETMGGGNEAAIIAIGATKFKMSDNRKIVDSFYTRVSLASSVACGLKMDASTVEWWMAADRADARAALLVDEAVDLPEALDGFMQWYGNISLPTWGNGATFDNVIMRNAYAHVGQTCPWSFRDDRCYRTVRALFPPVSVAPAKGVSHHALSDAIRQTYMLQKLAQQDGFPARAM